MLYSILVQIMVKKPKPFPKMCVKCYGRAIHIPWFTGLSRSTLETLFALWILAFLSALCGAVWDCLWPCFLPSTLVLAPLSWADMFQLFFNTFTCASRRQRIFTLATLCQVSALGTHSLCTKHTWNRAAMHWQDWQCKLLQMLLALNPTWVPAYACQCPAASHHLLQIVFRLSQKDSWLPLCTAARIWEQILAAVWSRMSWLGNTTEGFTQIV